MALALCDCQSDGRTPAAPAETVSASLVYLQYGRELLTRQWRYCFALKGGALSSYYRVSLGPKREIPVTMTRSVLRKIG